MATAPEVKTEKLPNTWAVTTGGLWAERDYHKRFAQWWMRGEWFERCPEIEAEIARLSQRG